MAEQFLSEIRLFSFGFPPKGWASCNGQLLPINQNQALFALLGTTYGGNGQTNFALPDLRGKAPIHTGNGHTPGGTAGAASVALNQQQMPDHTHTLAATNNGGSTANPSGAFLGAFNLGYLAPTALTTLRPESVSGVGGNQPHNNMMPYLALNFCIALVGIFPSRN
ncbi:MAG: phage tail protein [Gammaproteobacteria bacterium]